MQRYSRDWGVPPDQPAPDYSVADAAPTERDPFADQDQLVLEDTPDAASAVHQSVLRTQEAEELAQSSGESSASDEGLFLRRAALVVCQPPAQHQDVAEVREIDQTARAGAESSGSDESLFMRRAASLDGQASARHRNVRQV